MNSLAISRHLLWKDYRQLRPAIIGCWAIMATILLLTCVRQLLANGRETILPDAIMLVLAAPTLAAMAASGILIGHERQTRTWNWSSSLPIPWTSSLLSKSIVWLVSSGLMVGTLYLLFLILMQVCRSQGLDRGTHPEWITPQMVVTTVLVVPLLVYVCFSFAALLWNDTLTAFVGAALVVSMLYIVCSDFLPAMISRRGVYHPLDTAPPLLGIVLTVSLLVVAVVFMVRAYQWRWTTGQLASFGWTRRVSAPVSRLQRQLLWQNAAWSGPAPGEFWMLLTHALSISLWLRLLVLAGTSGMTIFIARTGGPSSTAFIAGMFGAAIMGVTVFAADQSQAAYKFLADRGVSWRKLLIAHALPPYVLAMIPVVLALAVEYRTVLSSAAAITVLFLATAAFGLGLFCSLCTRLTLLSACLTVGTMIAVIMAYSAVQNFYYTFVYHGKVDEPPQIIIALLFLGEASVLAAATILLVKRWLIYDRVRGGYYYLATIFVALVPTHLLAVGLCFLTIPNVPWQGVEEFQVILHSPRPRAELNVHLPLSMERNLYSTDVTHMPAAIDFGLQRMRMALPAANPTPSEEVDTPAEGMAGLGVGIQSSSALTVERISASLKLLEKELDRLPADASIDTWSSRLPGEVENTAWLAYYATHELKDLELARRAWKVNRRLLSLFDYSVLDATHSINCRLVSALLRSQLTVSEWEFLRTGGDLAELQPETVSAEQWSFLARMQATTARRFLRSHPLRPLIFPLAWHEERAIALGLQQTLESISGGPVTNNWPVHTYEWSDVSSIPRIISLEARLPH